MSGVTDWPVTTLAECCEIVSGSTPRRDHPEYWNGDINWATPRDLSHLNGPVLDATEEMITRQGLGSCSTTMLPQGAVLFSSRAPVGLVAIAGRPMCTNQGFKSLIPGPKVDSGYLYWFLKRAGKTIEHSGNGTTFTEVSKAGMERVQIPLPPLTEQRRIAALLDRADAVRRKREESRRLVDELLRSVFLEMFGDPVRNEKGWETLPLGQLAQVRRGASPRPIEHFMGGTVPWIKIGDATSSSSLYIERTAGFVTEEGAERSVLLRPGAIVVANSGVSLGFARILGISGCIHDGWLSVEGLDLRVSPIYFVSLINEMTERLRAMAPAGTQPNLNTTLLKDLLIPLPPPAVQERFSVMVHQVQNLRLSQQNATYQGGNLSTLAWGMLR